jgi:hypothetical protein
MADRDPEAILRLMTKSNVVGSRPRQLTLALPQFWRDSLQLPSRRDQPSGMRGPHWPPLGAPRATIDHNRVSGSVEPPCSLIHRERRRANIHLAGFERRAEDLLAELRSGCLLPASGQEVAYCGGDDGRREIAWRGSADRRWLESPCRVFELPELVEAQQSSGFRVQSGIRA